MTVDTSNLQTGLYAALIAADVAGGRVYDRLRQDSNPTPGLPIVNIGPKVHVNDDTTSGDALEVTYTLDVWSRYDGSKEINDVQTEIRSALHQQDLTVTGLASCICYVEGGSDFMDQDGQTRHGVIRVRCQARV